MIYNAVSALIIEVDLMSVWGGDRPLKINGL